MGLSFWFGKSREARIPLRGTRMLGTALSYPFHWLWESSEGFKTLPRKTRQLYYKTSMKLRENAEVWVYPKSKDLGFTPKGVFAQKLQSSGFHSPHYPDESAKVSPTVHEKT